MLGLSGDDGILGAKASGNKFSAARWWLHRASGLYLGAVRSRERWALREERGASGTSSLFHDHQPGSSEEVQSVGRHCRIVLLKLQLLFGFGSDGCARPLFTTSLNHSHFPKVCSKISGIDRQCVSTSSCFIHAKISAFCSFNPTLHHVDSAGMFPLLGTQTFRASEPQTLACCPGMESAPRCFTRQM